MHIVKVAGRTFLEGQSVRFGEAQDLWQISLDKPANETIEVGYRILPGTGGVSTEQLGNGTTDVFGALEGSVTFAPGQRWRDISLMIDSDALPEAPESVVLEVTGVLNGADAQLEGDATTLRENAWIFDDDSGPIGPVITAPEIIEALDGTRYAEFGVFAPATDKGAYVLQMSTADGTATAGSDYVAISQFAFFLSGGRPEVANPKFFSVEILPDFDVEGPETFVFEVTGSVGFTRVSASVEATIQDAGRPPATETENFLQGTPEADVIYLPPGENTNGTTYKALSGDDIIVGNDGRNVISGGAGKDSMSGGKGADTLRGGDGNDFLSGDKGDDRLFGGNGDDQIFGGENNDLLEGGDGDDWLQDGRGNDILRGNDGDDRLEGGFGADKIFGGDGDDFIFGGDGHDLLHGGAQNDTIEGGRGNDVIAGGAGNDVITDGAGDDILRGGAGNDIITATNGSDLVFGGDGDDILSAVTTTYARSPVEIILNGGAGNDVLNGNKVVSTLLIGGSGNDRLNGGRFTDTLIGGDGNDTLNGEGGNDILIGGRGNDTFVFDLGSRYERETIKGFEGAGSAFGDIIDLSALNAAASAWNYEKFEFQGVLTRPQGLEMEGSNFWVTEQGVNTILFASPSNANGIYYTIRIEDGIHTSASDYTVDDFIF